MGLPFPEYDELDATGLAAAVAAGQVSPAEVLEAAIARCEARNPALNAVVIPLFDRARARAASLPQGPLRGVPFLLKDLKITLEGTVTTNGCRLLKATPATVSSVLATRYEAAGLQMMGKSASPEFGIMGITEPVVWGPCRNPWDPAHTPGGSSGGAAAAVAARIVPVAHGGDGGGSIRIPASACGLVGLKPTRGRVTQAPHAGDSWQGYVQEHVLARSVRDSALLLDIADAPTPGEPYVAPPRSRPWIEEVGAAPGRLRIAFTRDALYATGPQHPDCVAAVDDAVALLRALGHDVVEATPSFPREELVRAYLLTVAAGVAVFCEEAAAKAGVAPRAADFEPGTWVLSLIGQRTSAAALERARRVVQRAAREVAAFFTTHDLFLTSTLARLPVRVGELQATPAEAIQARALSAMPLRALLDVALDRMASGRLAATPNTQLFNQTGQPAISLPTFWSPSGLPVGVQLAARFGDEATLLRVAAQIEEARPWAHRRPALVTAG